MQVESVEVRKTVTRIGGQPLMLPGGGALAVAAPGPPGGITTGADEPEGDVSGTANGGGRNGSIDDGGGGIEADLDDTSSVGPSQFCELFRRRANSDPEREVASSPTSGELSRYRKVRSVQRLIDWCYLFELERQLMIVMSIPVEIRKHCEYAVLLKDGTWFSQTEFETATPEKLGRDRIATRLPHLHTVWVMTRGTLSYQ